MGADRESSPYPDLQQRARQLPDAPGVYLFKDEQERVIYVGKALSLRSRVGSYFTASTDLGPRKQPMLDLIRGIDVIEAEGEWEALLLESRLIKDTRPRFNVMLKDDKTYPYLAVTTRDEFPGVYITRAPSEYSGARIFGPFASSTALREAMQLLQQVFRFRTCHLDIRSGDPANRHFRPCILNAIDLCTAPCADRIDAKDYKSDINRFLRFLNSQRSTVIRELKAEMQAASDARDYERAASFRDQLDAIERLSERETRRRGDGTAWQPEVTVFTTDPAAALRSLQRALEIETPIRCMEAIDIAHLGGRDTVGSKVCFIDGRPYKEGYRRYKVRTAGNDDFQSMREVVSRRYSDAGQGLELYPDVILLDGGRGQLNAALEVFETLEVQPPRVIALAKKDEELHLPERPEPLRLSRHHAGLRLCQAIRDEAHRFAQHYHHLLRSKSIDGDGSARS
ncbi:MAG: excinuclease ABC subunit UvrC [Planctomycetota bacterium]|nr:excinuclease ABC subunit UvrC [Planctomycetota bacterium]